MSDRVFSDFVLERYLLGELPREDAAEVDRAAAADARVRAALTDLEGSNRDILARYPAPSFKARLFDRLEDRTSPAPKWPRWAVPVSAAAALVLALLWIGPQFRRPTGDLAPGLGGENDLVKGDAALDLTRTQLLVYKKTGELAKRVADGSVAGPGAILQLAYVTASERFGVILSIDGRGEVTRHFPVDAGGSTALSLRQRVLLPAALELDDAPGFERFFLITSSSPIDVGTVLDKAQALARDPVAAERADLDLPVRLKQTSVLILKVRGSR
jgi:hypothetical protein